MMKAEPVRLAGALRQFPGKWVAFKDGEVVEAGDNPDELIVALKERGIRDATIIRSPGTEEPQLVGLG